MADSLEARIRMLEDIEAIRALKARYCQACDDNHNPDRVAACFVEEGVWESASLNISARGHAGIKAYIGGVRENGGMVRSAHLVMNPIIRVDGDRATGQWRLVMLYTKRGKAGPNQYYRIIGAYDDTYLRRDGQWLMERLSVVVEEHAPYAVEPAE